MNFWERDENTYKNYNQTGFGNQYSKQYSNNDVKTEETQNKHGENNLGSQTWHEKIEEYAGKSQDELMSELLTTANRMRRDGQLSNADLESFYNRASAFLNDEQRARMSAIINMLKKIDAK